MSDLPLNLARIIESQRVTIEQLQVELATAHAIHAGIAKDIDRLRTQRDAAVNALKDAIEEMNHMRRHNAYKSGYHTMIERLTAALENAA